LEEVHVGENMKIKTGLSASGLGNWPVVSFGQRGNEISGLVK
jgi:hypothetical protein